MNILGGTVGFPYKDCDGNRLSGGKIRMVPPLQCLAQFYDCGEITRRFTARSAREPVSRGARA